MEITIYYTRKNLDPDRQARLSLGMKQIIPVKLEETHVPVFTVHAPSLESEKFEIILEDIFYNFNIDDNPLATRYGQTIIKNQGASHTSMSVGDVVRFTDKGITSYYVCASIGWKKLPVNTDI